MKEQTPEEKLKLIEAALDHIYGIDTETLLCSYRDHLEKKAQAKNPPPPVDRETAIAYFQTIPEKCNNDEALEMKKEMLSALAEEEFQALCEEQVKAHPDIEDDIRSMFSVCLSVKRLL